MPEPAEIAARIRRWEQEGPQGPLTLELYPTLACNLDCAFCDTTDRHRPPVNELSRERLLEIVDEAADLGVRRVFVLGGGEPLLRKDATPALMARVKERGMEGVLTTNGTLLDAPLRAAILAMGWDEIHVSLDGPTPEVHDALRGVRGAFRRTVRATCALAVEKRRAGLVLPRLALHVVVTRTNFHLLTDMVRLAHALGAFRVDFDALIAYKPEQQALKLSPAEAAKLPEIAAAALRLAEELGIATTLARFLDPATLARGDTAVPIPEEPGLAGAPCLKAWHYLVVQADGRTSPCCVLAGEGGSAREQPLAAIWERDPFLLGVREGMLEKRPLPRCRECSWNILGHEAHIRSFLQPGATACPSTSTLS